MHGLKVNLYLMGKNEINLSCHGDTHLIFLKAKTTYKKPRFLLSLWDLMQQGGCTSGPPLTPISIVR